MSDKYYKLHTIIEENYKLEKFHKIIKALEETIPLYKELVESEKREFGDFSTNYSVALEKGGLIAFAIGEIDLLKKIESELRSIPETQNWADRAKEFIENCEIGNQIINVVSENPGISQLEIKQKIELKDQSEISFIIYWLAKVNRLTRNKYGRSYKLYPKE